MEDSPIDEIIRLKEQYCVPQQKPKSIDETQPLKSGIGSVWIDSVSGTIWICNGVIEGAAVWQRLGNVS
jgi:hypothetical protein